jgi:ribonucleoside-diphosphate reductase alpha chain
VFRELAISYMERFDLGHVDPSETQFDALGKGEAEGKAPTASSFVSKGLTRSRTDRLQVVRSDATSAAAVSAPSVVTPIHGATGHGHSHDVEGATALKTETVGRLSPTEQLEKSAKVAVSEKRAEAKAKGYEGDACGECQNYTLVRNGTCMKCDTCGSTTGCS